MYKLRDRSGWTVSATVPSDGAAIAVLQFAMDGKSHGQVRLDLGKQVLLDQPPVAMTKEVVREIAAEVDALVKAAPATFDPKERAAEKQRSRDEDARAIASGEATVADIRRKNAAFRVGKVDIFGSKR